MFLPNIPPRRLRSISFFYSTKARKKIYTAAVARLVRKGEENYERKVRSN